MSAKKERPKKASPFQVTWDMMIYVPLYALLILAIFFGISYLMMEALELVSFHPASSHGVEGSSKVTAGFILLSPGVHA